MAGQAARACRAEHKSGTARTGTPPRRRKHSQLAGRRPRGHERGAEL